MRFGTPCDKHDFSSKKKRPDQSTQKKRSFGGARSHPITARSNRYLALEREADLASLTVNKGAFYSADRLSSIPAAKFRNNGSLGSKLLTSTRIFFEEGYGADLRNIRIHNDRRANTIAYKNGVKA